MNESVREHVSTGAEDLLFSWFAPYLDVLITYCPESYKSYNLQFAGKIFLAQGSIDWLCFSWACLQFAELVSGL